MRGVDFQFNSVRLAAPAQRTLDDVAAGADSVKSYLIRKGVHGDSLTARGFGKVNPVASNATAEGRAQNRRVAFVVTNAPELELKSAAP